MQITALVQVINFLKEKAVDPALIEGYRKLTETVREASKNPDGEFSSKILKLKEQLKTILLESDPGNWGYASYNLFEKIDNGKLLGKPGAEYLDKLFTNEGSDYTAVYNELSKKTKLLPKFTENLNKFIQLYDQVIPAEENETPDDSDRSSIFLYFEGRLSVHNVTDLERYSGLWEDILGVFSVLSAEEKPELDINSYQNGKIILEVSPAEMTLSSLMSGTSGVLALLPVILKIRKIQLELIPLPLSRNVNELLEQEIHALISDASLEVAQKLVISHFGKVKNPDEATSDLALSLKQIFSFIEKGGKIEFKTRESVQETTKLNMALADSYATARELEEVTCNLAVQLAGKDE